MKILKYYRQCAIVTAATLACSSWAQEQARVISSTPVYQSVTVTQLVDDNYLGRLTTTMLAG